jgi:HEAT repeat protein
LWRASIEALGAIGPEGIGLLGAALRNRNPDVRHASIGVLAKMGTGAAGPLINALEDADLRWAAFEALVTIGPGAVGALTAALSRSKNGNVLEKAAQALGKIGPTAAVAIEALGTLLRDPDQMERVRKAAAEALGQIGGPATELLVRALNDRSVGLRQAAAEALGNAGDTAALRALSALVSGDKDSGVRRAAAAALGKMGAEAVGPLIAALGDTDEVVRLVVVQALGGIGPDASAASGPLCGMLHDQDNPVRNAASEALRKIRGWRVPRSATRPDLDREASGNWQPQ